MMQITCAVAGALAANVAFTCQQAKTAKSILIASTAMAIGNAIMLHHTANVCHSLFEAVDGVKWAAAIVGGTWLAVRTIKLLAETSWGMHLW